MRRELGWLRLDELAAFTQTDLRTDPELVSLLDSCGCGHLFTLIDENDFMPQPKPFANTLRRYLRMAA